MNTKGALRTKYKNLRARLTQEEIKERSFEIAQQLSKLDIWNHTHYHLFLSISSHKEIDTSFILKILADKEKKVVASKSDFKTNKLMNYLLTDKSKLVVNNYGIPEPVGGSLVLEQTIDVVFVPLLAYDKKGNRIGYGKGFYDEFLSKCRPGTLKIGLSLFEPEEQIEDVYENDIPLDICITPKKIYSFKE